MVYVNIEVASKAYNKTGKLSILIIQSIMEEIDSYKQHANQLLITDSNKYRPIIMTLNREADKCVRFINKVRKKNPEYFI